MANAWVAVLVAHQHRHVHASRNHDARYDPSRRPRVASALGCLLTAAGQQRGGQGACPPPRGRTALWVANGSAAGCTHTHTHTHLYKPQVCLRRVCKRERALEPQRASCKPIPMYGYACGIASSSCRLQEACLPTTASPQTAASRKRAWAEAACHTGVSMRTLQAAGSVPAAISLLSCWISSLMGPLRDLPTSACFIPWPLRLRMMSATCEGDQVGGGRRT